MKNSWWRRRPPKILGVDLADVLAERRRAGMSFAAGLLVLLLIQVPSVEQSFLGAPDREMMETAFRLRSDIIGGKADPVLFIDIDDRTLARLGGGPFSPPLATVPRAVLADLLDFMRTAPANQAPRVVMMDVDIAQPPSDGQPGVSRLQKAMSDWAATPTAPPLVISRQSYPAETVGMNAPGHVLPSTPYDSIVAPAPNVFWSEAQVLGDQNGVIRDFLPFECVITPQGVKTLYSAALIAYQFAETDPKVLEHAGARHWMGDAVRRCATPDPPPLKRGELIDYHLSLDLGFLERVWPDLDPAWPGFAQCGHVDTSIFRRLSAIDVLDAIHAGGDVSHDLLCGHLVIIGGTNASAGDFIQTPLNEMNGSVVLANCVRGLELSHGGLRQAPLVAQIFLLLLVSLAISASAAATSQARHHYVRLREDRHRNRLTHHLTILPLNPIILNGLIALTAHCLGIAMLFVSLNYGIWGSLSAPAFAAAITETIQEFTSG